MRAVDTIIRPAQVKRLGAERIVGPRRHIGGPFGVALEHRRRRPPAWSLDLAHDARATTARQVLAQRHGGRIELVGPTVFAPEMHGAGIGIAEDRTVLERREIGLPIEHPEGGNIAPHGFRYFALDLHRAIAIDTLSERRGTYHGRAARKECAALHGLRNV